ncbi:MAG: hypothetical protein WBM48_01020 [Polyangiales bacterium]
MKTGMRALLLVTMFGLVGLTACKNSKDTDTAADTKPTRPPTPSGTMSLHGAYSQTGAMGTFRDCTTGEQWTVAHEGDNKALEQAYAEARGTSGYPLVVTVEGGIDYRPRSDGSGREIMLIVARFVKRGPGETCP